MDQNMNDSSSPTTSTAPRKIPPMDPHRPPTFQDPTQREFAQTLPLPSNGVYGSFIGALGSTLGFLGSIPCCFCLPNPYRDVNQGQVGLVTRFGKFYRAVDPGLVYINPLSEKLHRVNVTVQVLDNPQQNCMTKDNVSIMLSSVLYYHIIQPQRALFAINDVTHALKERTQTTLRHVVGARPLQDIIERREEVAAAITEILEEVASDWGIRVEALLIKDITLSEELQDTLSQAAKSKRLGESKIIMARSEVESAKLMRKAADILQSKAAMQIRYLEAMQAMAKSSGSKVIFMPGSANFDGPEGKLGGGVEFGKLGDKPALETVPDDDFQKTLDSLAVREM